MIYVQRFGEAPTTTSSKLTAIDTARNDILAWVNANPLHRHSTDAQLHELTQPCASLIGFDQYDCWLDRANVLWGQTQEIATRAVDVSAMISAAVGQGEGGAFATQAAEIGEKLYGVAMQLIRMNREVPAKIRALRAQQVALRQQINALAPFNDTEQSAVNALNTEWAQVVVGPLDYIAAIAFTAREMRDKVLVPFETKAFQKALSSTLLKINIIGRLGDLLTAVFTFPGKVVKSFLKDVGEGTGAGVAGIIKPLVIWVGIPALVGLGAYTAYKRWGKPPESK